MIAIYKAAFKDASDIKNLLRISWENTYSNLYSPEEIETMSSKFHNLEFLTSQIENPKILFLIAVENNKIVAMCNTDETDGKVINIQRMHVSPTHHRKGIGSLLMQKVIDAFPNVRKIELEVEKENTNAIAFYSKQGFKNVGEKVYTFESVEMPCFVMEKEFKLNL
jgi:ribosomal protein S18 acetylase RimI-like enzyme